jgi:hypothetical protein
MSLRRRRRAGRRASLLGLAAVISSALAVGTARAQDPSPGKDDRLADLKKALDEQARKLDEQAREIERQRRELETLKARIDLAAPVSSGSPAAPVVASPGAPQLYEPAEPAPEREHIEEEPKPSEVRARHEPFPRPSPLPRNAVTPTRAPEGQPFDDSFHWSYQNGWFAAGRFLGEDFLIRFMGRVQLDYRFFPTGQRDAPEDQFLIRRARIGIFGELGPVRYRFELAPLENETRTPRLPISHFWFTWEQFPAVMPLFGHYKTPFTLEDGFMSSNWIDFIERPMVIGSGDGVSPHYNPGAEVMGSIGGPWFQYWLSVQNQEDSNTVLSDDPLIAGRLESDFLGFTLGADAYGERRPGSARVSFEGVTAGKFVWFTPVGVRGWTYAWGADASAYIGPFWARAEYIWANQERKGEATDGGDEPSLLVRGGVLTVGWHFWGPLPSVPRPQPPFKGWDLFSLDLVKPRNRPDVGMELVFRAEYEDFTPQPSGLPFRAFFFGSTRKPVVSSSDPNAAQPARVYALDTGINFDPIEGVRFMADWYHYIMENDAHTEARHSRQADEFLFRAQYAF